ncbi:MAG: phosphotransferase [Chloroflexota bacterium]|nr:phosphotransferase [Chloroflexota bacterium]MDE2940772.1 phosphotransferase [Chloroflexota bacterium]MDE3266954.1 phosphotransferase [Chloroflexota bacterium]
MSAESAFAAFTNDVTVVECKDRAGRISKLVIKHFVDEPEFASKCAKASFRALEVSKMRGVPVPQPILKDETGELLGTPGLVTSFVEGRQIASPTDVVAWANELADLLLLIHSIRPSIDDRGLLCEGQEEALFILREYAASERVGHPLSNEIYGAVGDLKSHLASVPAVLLHMDYWQGNVLWDGDHVSAVVDWDFASYGDPAIDVAYFRMNMYLRGIKPAADIFLTRYEEVSGKALKNLGFWEVVAAARALPSPALWIPASREMGDLTATDDRANTDYFEFVADAIQRAYDGV